ncbi:PAS domain S-box protein [Paenibacillus sp. MBLB4367]|uniref:PAS domain S-box protein n=1 Tax=Paenibacillus sp. MBLB4367 TaxID=3384767 RepID=UPI003907FE87
MIMTGQVNLLSPENSNSNLPGATPEPLQDGSAKRSSGNAGAGSERRFEDSAQALFKLLEHGPDAFALLDARGDVLHVNAAFERLFGWSSRETVGMPFPIIAETCRSAFDDAFGRLLNGGEPPIEVTVAGKRKDGSSVEAAVALASACRDREAPFVCYAVIRDVGDKRLIEQAIRDSEAKYRLVAEHMSDLILLIGPDETIRYASPSICALVGLSEERVVGEALYRFIHPLDLPSVTDKFREAFVNGGDVRCQFRVLQAEGGWGVIEARSVVLSGNEGGMLITACNITKLKQAEQATIEAEAMYRNLVEKALVGVYMVRNDRFLYVNPRFAEIFGYSREEVLAKPSIWEDIHPDDRELVAVNMQRRLSGESSALQYGFRVFRKDGNLAQVELSGTITVYQGETVLIGTLLDVTERKEAEELLLRSEKLSIVGQLAAGVAHEIRNPLTALKGFMQLLRSRSHDFLSYFEIMLAELERINAIVSEFVLVAKPQAVRFEWKDNAAMLRSVVSLLEPQAAFHNVRIVSEYETDLPPLFCDENQIKQVYINLLKNAIDAMPEGGVLRIEMTADGDRSVTVQVIDRGVGIPYERIGKLGEPFYTTKEKGTGLGLMVSYKIVEHHKGELRIESREGEGTTATVTLPVRQAVLSSQAVPDLS